jgi:hypothetical protein
MKLVEIKDVLVGVHCWNTSDSNAVPGVLFVYIKEAGHTAYLYVYM